MKKKTILTSAIALATGALIGAVSPTPIPFSEAISQQETVADQSANDQPAGSQAGGGLAGSARQAANDIEEFGRSLSLEPRSSSGGRPNKSYPKRWAMPGPKRPNRIIRSRRTKRKHRRS